MTTQEIKFEVVRDTESLSALRSDWERLWAACAPEFYTLSFAAVWLAWTRTHEPKGHRLHVVVGRIDNRVAVIWPMMVRRERSGKVWRLAVWLGREPVDYGDILVENPKENAPLIRATLKHLVATVAADVISLQAVRPDANVFAVLDGDCRHKLVDDTSPFVDLRQAGDWESFEAKLTSKFRREMRRHLRRLEEAGTVEIAFDQGSEPLEETVQWITKHKKEWIDHRGIAEGYGLSPEDVEATIELLREADQAGKIMIARLTVNGSLVAADVNHIFDGRLFMDSGSFDLAWGKYAPGLLLMRAQIQWAFDNDVTVFDLARGAYDYKLKWSDQTAELTRYLYSRGLLGKIYVLLRASEWGKRLAQRKDEG